MYEKNERESLAEIANELHNIAVELRNYNQIGRELLEIQRRLFNPVDVSRSNIPGHDRDFYYDDRRMRY